MKPIRYVAIELGDTASENTNYLEMRSDALDEEWRAEVERAAEVFSDLMAQSAQFQHALKVEQEAVQVSWESTVVEAASESRSAGLAAISHTHGDECSVFLPRDSSDVEWEQGVNGDFVRLACRVMKGVGADLIMKRYFELRRILDGYDGPVVLAICRSNMTARPVLCDVAQLALATAFFRQRNVH